MGEQSTINPISINRLTAEAIAVNRRIKLDSNGKWAYADAHELEDATSTDNVASGSHLAGRTRNQPGSLLLEVASAVSAGAFLYGADDGKVSTTKTGRPLYKAVRSGSGSGSWVEVVPVETDGSGLVNAIVADSAAITAGTETTPSNGSKTIDGAELKVGDVFRVRACAVVDTTTGAETARMKLYVGTEEIADTGAVDATNGDLCYIDAEIVVRAVGASGKLSAAGITMQGAPGTNNPKVFKKDEATEDLSSSVAIAVKITHSSTGESTRLMHFAVEKLRQAA